LTSETSQERPIEETAGPPSPEDPPEELGLFSEFVFFLKENKKWWLIPIFVTILLLGLLVVLGGSPVAPFIYTLF